MLSCAGLCRESTRSEVKVPYGQDEGRDRGFDTCQYDFPQRGTSVDDVWATHELASDKEGDLVDSPRGPSSPGP